MYDHAVVKFPQTGVGDNICVISCDCCMDDCMHSSAAGHEGVQCVVPCGCETVQAGPAQYCEEMELHVQRASHQPCYKQVGGTSILRDLVGEISVSKDLRLKIEIYSSHECIHISLLHPQPKHPL